MKKKFVIILLFFILLVSQTGNVGAASSFRDIPTNYPYAVQIQELVSTGVISGYADNTFRPNEVVTRGQFAAFVSRALKLEKSTVNFKDVTASMSLKTEIGRAATAGIIKGFADGNFKPNTPVTRADIAVMLDRALQLKGSYKNAVNLTYADKSKVTGYSVESVKRMTAYGIMGATSSANRFEPQTYGTRVSTVSAIYNMLKVLEGKGKVYPDGWVAPVLKSAWSPNHATNLATLQNELGFVKGGTTYAIEGHSNAINIVGSSPSSPDEVEISFYFWTDANLTQSYRIPIVAKEVFKLYFGGDANRVWDYFNNNEIPEEFTANGRTVKAFYSESVGAITLQVGKK